VSIDEMISSAEHTRNMSTDETLQVFLSSKFHLKKDSTVGMLDG
jgi:hypothetical protein